MPFEPPRQSRGTLECGCVVVWAPGARREVEAYCDAHWAKDPPQIPQERLEPNLHPLPVLATLFETTRSIGKDWRGLFKAIAPPGLAIATAIMVFRSPEHLRSLLPGLPEFLQDLLLGILAPLILLGFTTMIVVSSHRVVLLGRESLPSPWGLSWSPRETRALGWVYVIGFYFFFVFYALLLLLMALPFEAIGGAALSVPPLIAMYVSARFSLVLPSTSMDWRPTLDGSWRLTRRSGWRLVILAVLSSLPLAPMAFAMHQMGGAATRFLEGVSLVLLVVVESTSLSKAFCWLTAEVEAPDRS